MRPVLKLVVVLALSVFVVSSIFAFLQARQEEHRLREELERRSFLLSESLQETIWHLMARNDTDGVRRVLDKFSNRERLLGAILSDSSGNVVLSSSGLAAQIPAIDDFRRHDIGEVVTARLGYGHFVSADRQYLHIYSAPVWDEEDIVQVLSLVHNAAYIQQRVHRIWLHNFYRTIANASIISLITILVFYVNVLLPIKKTVAWIKTVRRGDGDSESLDDPLFKPLTREVSRMARSLESARLAVEAEARLRHSSQTLWTPERLKEFVRIKLNQRSLFVVSNREPYMHLRKGKKIERIVPASGLVTAIEPILKACGGMWIAQGAGDADRETADSSGKLRVPPEEPQYVLKRVWISSGEEQGYYYGFSNEGLWPLCHIVHTRPTFREEDWACYGSVNRKFARAVIKELEGTSEPCVLIQDYHFGLLPRMVKDGRPDARIALFWHIPWPNPEAFGICPWQRDILHGMLGADIVGFHTQFHCNNFIETVDRCLESRIDYEHFTVHRGEHTTWVKPFPISIDPAGEVAGLERTDARCLLRMHGIDASIMAVGVDRLDYTKGILERLAGIELFLRNNDRYIGEFTFVQIGAPTRTAIPKYGEFLQEIDRAVERINRQFKTKHWKPILFLKKHHSHEQILPYYRAARLCLVTSLSDGMNLVAKEFVVSCDPGAVLILSQFTGAARELRDALIVNPYDTRQVSEAIRAAIEMSPDDRRERIVRMRAHVQDRNVYRWAGELVGELAQVRLGSEQLKRTSLEAG
jgi:trehalose-6-phosphate synthase